MLCTNAFNLIDGIDGLAAGVGLTATLTTMIAGMLQGQVMLCLATAPLAGALIGFLRYNFNPASIFLGDCGSLLIGFLLGSCGVIWGQKSATLLGMAAPAMAIAFPLLEVGLSIARRFVVSEPIFNADRRHIHHLLLERGFTPKRVTLLLYGVCSVGAALSLLESLGRNRLTAVVIVFFIAMAWLGIQYLGYVEFEATRRFLWGGLRPVLRAHVNLELLERSLVSARSVQQCWSALEKAAQSLGYSQMNARMSGLEFSTAPRAPRQTAFWQMRLNLSPEDYLNVKQQGEQGHQPAALMPFIEVVRRIMPEKLAQFETARATPGQSKPITYATCRGPVQASPRNSSTTSVMSSDCVAPSVKAVTAS